MWTSAVISGRAQWVPLRGKCPKQPAGRRRTCSRGSARRASPGGPGSRTVPSRRRGTLPSGPQPSERAERIRQRSISINQFGPRARAAPPPRPTLIRNQKSTPRNSKYEPARPRHGTADTLRRGTEREKMGDSPSPPKKEEKPLSRESWRPGRSLENSDHESAALQTPPRKPG